MKMKHIYFKTILLLSSLPIFLSGCGLFTEPLREEKKNLFVDLSAIPNYYKYEENGDVPVPVAIELDCATLFNPQGIVLVNQGDEYIIGADGMPVGIGDRVITWEKSSVTIHYVTGVKVDFPENSVGLIDQCDAAAAPLVADAGPAPIPVAAPTDFNLPEPNDFVVLDQEWFRKDKTFEDILERLSEALDLAGFDRKKWRYNALSSENGFYILTDIERIKPFNGVPHKGPARWDLSRNGWNNRVRFRRFIFYVSTTPPITEKEITYQEHEEHVKDGERYFQSVSYLDVEFQEKPSVTALVYVGDVPEDIFSVVDSTKGPIDAITHLKESGILQDTLTLASRSNRY